MPTLHHIPTLVLVMRASTVTVPCVRVTVQARRRVVLGRVGWRRVRIALGLLEPGRRLRTAIVRGTVGIEGIFASWRVSRGERGLRRVGRRRDGIVAGVIGSSERSRRMLSVRVGLGIALLHSIRTWSLRRSSLPYSEWLVELFHAAVAQLGRFLSGRVRH